MPRMVPNPCAIFIVARLKNIEFWPASPVIAETLGCKRWLSARKRHAGLLADGLATSRQEL